MGKLTRVNEILVAPDIPTVSGLRRNLRIRSTGTSVDVTVTADEVILGNANCTSYVSLPAVNLIGKTNTVGLNGMDITGVVGSTWYAIYVVYNALTNVSGLLFSTSEIAPALPTGFEYYAKVGWIRTDTTGNRYALPLITWNNMTQYSIVSGSNLTAFPIIISGVVGTTNGGKALTLSAVAVNAFIPPTANRIILAVTNSASNGCCIAPNNNASYNGWKSNDNSPLIVEATNYTNYATRHVKLILESRYIYAATEGSNTRVKVIGWEDS